MSNAMRRRSPHDSNGRPDPASPEPGCPSRARPIDLVHLARQTCGDRALEREILDLMARQIAIIEARLELAEDDERAHIVHAAKGSARNVGAFPLAQAAERLEADPSAEARRAFHVELAKAAAFIAALRS